MASFLFGTKSLTKRLITYILSISVYIQAFSFCTIYLTLFFFGFQFIVDYINLIIYARNTCMEHTILIETCQIKFLHLFPTTRCTCYRPSGVTTVTEVGGILCRLLVGEFSDVVNRASVIDCRYPYEYTEARYKYSAKIIAYHDDAVT